MTVVELGFLIDINMCFILPEDQQISNEGWFFASKSQYKRYGILWLTQNVVTENTKKAYIRNLWEILIEDNSIWQIYGNDNILPQQVCLAIK